MPTITYETPDWLNRWIEEHDSDPDKLGAKQREKLATIGQANKILEDYHKQGYQLTLRQLYYQFVARDLIPNTNASYKKLGQIVSDGRMWGFIDWDHLVDRGRNFERRTIWEHPETIIDATARSFSVDRWQDSPVRLEVWVEKQALEQVIEQACDPFDVGYLACKGYMSMSEMWQAAQRAIRYERKGQQVIILHLGDHDPSGIDMTRDIQDRFHTFGSSAQVERIALNMDQIEEHQPPPNPAKVTDSRAEGYIDQFGYESWELDALPPAVLDELIRDSISPHMDSAYTQHSEREDEGTRLLEECSSRWDEVVGYLEE